MAPIAATLLCYYPDHIAFVMLVRMWQDKELKNFFSQEFDGLMTAFKALDETLVHRPVGRHLVHRPFPAPTHNFHLTFISLLSFRLLLFGGANG
jgi:Rab-GTPase-TBC domain